MHILNIITIVIPGLTRDLGGCCKVRGPGDLLEVLLWCSAPQERLDRDDNLL